MAILRFSLIVAVATGCVGFDPYKGGGGWLAPALDDGFTRLCSPPDPRQVGPDIGDLARDFRLFDQYAYRVNLSDFCHHTVLLTVGELGDPELVDLIDRLPDIVAQRLPSATQVSPFIVLTTWYRTPDGAVPTLADLRAFGHDLGVDPDTADIDGIKVPLLQDGPRFTGAAPAAAAQWAATDAPGELRGRFQLEREVAGRWALRSTPFYVVLHPGLRIVACGTDLEADQILEAVAFPPMLFDIEPNEDGQKVLNCTRRSER